MQFVTRACFCFLACAAAGVSSTAAPDKPPSVSVESTGEPMRSLIPRIGEAAGQRIVSGPHSADRRFFLFVRERPLPEVMGQLRRFIAFKPGGAFWFREGSGSVLDEDLASLRARQRAGEKRKRDLYRRALNQLEEFSEWARERPGDPIGLAAAKRRAREFLNIFRLLPRNVQHQALSGHGMAVSTGTLSHELQRAITRRTGIGAEAFRPARSGQSKWIPHVGFFPRQYGDRSSLQIVLLTAPSGGSSITDILNPPRWPSATGADYRHVMKEHRARRHGPEAMNRISSLQKTVLLRGGRDWTVGKTLSEFSLQSGIPLLGEYDPCYQVPAQPRISGLINLYAPLQGPAWKVLEEICSRFDLEWEYRLGWILIRSPRTIDSWAGILDLTPPAGPQPYFSSEAAAPPN